MGRLKSTVAQIRGQCANDVRKRDTEIKRLQKHLEARRGRDGCGQVGVTVVIPGVTKPKHSGTTNHHGGDIDSPTYSLKEETTEFLTQLSQDLSNENDALVGLVRTTLATLRSLQGLPERPDVSSNEDAEFSDPNITSSMPPSYEELAMNMDELLEHLRNLLTNPSFVPLEEVEIREDEILRLREGWDKMEARWREAITLMNGWRKRMMESGDTINLEDLRKGLNLDSEPIPTYQASREDSSPAEENSEYSVLSENCMVQVEQQMEEELEANTASPIKPSQNLGIGLFPAPNILGTSSGNTRRPSFPSSKSPRKVSFRANSPKIGALLDGLDESDDIALLDFNATHSPTKEQLETKEVRLQPFILPHYSFRSSTDTVIEYPQSAVARESTSRRRGRRRRWRGGRVPYRGAKTPASSARSRGRKGSAGGGGGEAGKENGDPEEGKVEAEEYVKSGRITRVVGDLMRVDWFWNLDELDDGWMVSCVWVWGLGMTWT